MTANSDSKEQMGPGEVLTVSVFSGLVLGFLLLCFMRPIAGLLGGLAHDFAGVVRRGVAAALLGLFALLPMTAVFQKRSDLTAFVLTGPQIGFWAVAVFYLGGVSRWGSPPDIMWPLAGGYVLYTTCLSIVALLLVRQCLGKKT